MSASGEEGLRNTSATLSEEPRLDANVEQPRCKHGSRQPWGPRMLLLYGLVVAAVGAAFLNASAPRPWPIEGSRTIHLNGALAELNSGGVVLWGKFRSPVLAATKGPDSYYYGPTSPGDDQGAFLYVPGLAHLLGLSDPLTAMRILYVALFFIPLLVYPLLFARLFSSTAAGLIAPWALLLTLRALGFHDIYWIAEWAIFALLPPLMRIARRWPRRGLVWVALLVVGASLANSIRAQSGLGVLLAAFLVVAARPWRWRWKLATIPLLLVAYLSISSFAFAGIRALRADQLGHGVSAQLNSHVFWHPLYLGLGYLPNRYGIQWDDSIAYRAVAAYRPHAMYPTPAYDAALRHLFLTLVEHDPGLLVRSIAAKVLVLLWLASPGILLLLLASPFLAALRGRSQPVIGALVLVVPSALVGLAPPALAMPYEELALGWLASVGMCCIVVLGWAAGTLDQPRGLAARAAALRGPVSEWFARSPVRAAAAPAVVLALIPVAFGARALEHRSDQWQASTPSVTIPAPTK